MQAAGDGEGTSELSVECLHGKYHEVPWYHVTARDVDGVNEQTLYNNCSVCCEPAPFPVHPGENGLFQSNGSKMSSGTSRSLFPYSSRNAWCAFLVSTT